MNTMTPDQVAPHPCEVRTRITERDIKIIWQPSDLTATPAEARLVLYGLPPPQVDLTLPQGICRTIDMLTGPLVGRIAARRMTAAALDRPIVPSDDVAAAFPPAIPAKLGSSPDRRVDERDPRENANMTACPQRNRPPKPHHGMAIRVCS